MNAKQTKRFVYLWNEKNGYEQGKSEQTNMRYSSPGIVFWNEHNSPVLDLNEVQELLKESAVNASNNQEPRPAPAGE